MHAHDPVARRLRRAAVDLARMAPVDRDWILAQLSPAERSTINDAINPSGDTATAIPANGQLATNAIGSGSSNFELPTRSVQVATEIARAPSAEWLAQALIGTFSSADRLRVLQALPRTTRAKLVHQDPERALTSLASRALAEAAEDAFNGSAKPADAPIAPRPWRRWFARDNT